MTEEKLVELLQTQYGLENVTLEFLREGGNKTYIVNGEKKYLIKVIVSAFFETAKQSVLVTRYLEENGFPVPKTILTKAGEAIVEVSGGKVAESAVAAVEDGAEYGVSDGEPCLLLLQEFIEGEEPNLEEPETAEKVGELVGKLHSLMENCQYSLFFVTNSFLSGVISIFCAKSHIHKSSRMKNLVNAYGRKLKSFRMVFAMATFIAEIFCRQRIIGFTFWI